MSDVITELANEANDKAAEIARLKAENAKLRESVKRLMTQRDERLARAETENAKLRELCADMLHDAMENICSKAYWCGEKNWQTCNDEECGNRLYVEMARELGVEVTS